MLLPRIILLMQMIISRTKVAATPATWSTLATTTSTSWPPFPLGIFQAKVELVINPAVFIPGFSFSCKIQTFRWLTSLKLHQKGHLKRRENEGRRLDIQVKGSQKKPHTKGRSLHTPIQLTYADCRPLPFFFLYSLQKYDMNAQKPNFPACMTPSLATWVEVALAPLVSAPAPSTQVGVTYNSKRR